MNTRKILSLLICFTVLAPLGRGGELSKRELDKLVESYFEVSHEERRVLEQKLGDQDVVAPKKVQEWRKKLLKLARQGPKSPLSGTNYLYDEKRKVGKYLVQGKKGKALVLGLHGGGAGAGDAGSAMSALGGTLGKLNAVSVYPEVLRKTEYGWGEEDTERFVLELIETIKRTRKIDTNQIYLTGHSMGGYGTWTIGARHADLFAGLAAFAGAATPVLAPDDPQRETVIGIEDGVLPNLHNLPIFFYQSLDDQNVPPWSNLFLSRELPRLEQEHGGYEHLFEQVEDRGHRMPAKGPGPGLAWAMSHQRNPRPKKIIWQPVRSWKRMFYWLWWEDPALHATLIAEVTKPNTVEITCDQEVDGLSILVDERLFDLKQEIEVHVNGEERFRGKVQDTLSTLLRTAAERNDVEMLFRARIDL